MNEVRKVSNRAIVGSKALAIASLCMAAAFLAAPAAADAQRGVGAAAPDFGLPAIEGPPVQLSQLRGRVVVIHFAATWCPFCNAELPHLVALDQAYKGRGVQVVLVDIKESKRVVGRWVSKGGVTFPVLLDGDGTVATRYAPKDAQPDLGRDEAMVAANLVIDKEGRIRFFSLLDTAQFDARLIGLRAVLDDLLAGR